MGLAANTLKFFATPITAPVKGAAALTRRMPTSVKNGAMITGLVAAGLGLATYLSLTPRGHEFHDEDRQVAMIPPILTPQDLMMNQSVATQEDGPQEGRGQYEWRNRARPDLAQQQQLAAQNPRMNAISPESVTELGSANPQLGKA